MEKRTGQEAGISTFHATTVTELLAQMQKYVIEHAVKGDQGNNITSIEFKKTGEDENLTYFTATVNIENTLPTTFNFSLPNGATGEEGNGIRSIDFIESHDEGNLRISTFQINYTKLPSVTATINVKNGTRISRILQGFSYQDGEGNTVTPITFEYEGLQSPLETQIKAKNGNFANLQYIYGSIPEVSKNNISCYITTNITNDIFQELKTLSVNIRLKMKPVGESFSYDFIANTPLFVIEGGQGKAIVPLGIMDNQYSSSSLGSYTAAITATINYENKLVTVILTIFDRYGNVVSPQNITSILQCSLKGF